MVNWFWATSPGMFARTVSGMERLLFVLIECPSWFRSLSFGWGFPCRRPLDHRTANLCSLGKSATAQNALIFSKLRKAYWLIGLANDAGRGFWDVSILDRLSARICESGNVASPRRRIR